MSKKKVTKSSGQAPAPSPEKQAKAARHKRKRDFVKQVVQANSLIVFFPGEVFSYGLDADLDIETFLMNEVYDWDNTNPKLRAIRSDESVVDIKKLKLVKRLYREEEYVIFRGGGTVSYFEMDQQDLLWFMFREVYGEDGANRKFQMIVAQLRQSPATNRDDMDDMLDLLDNEDKEAGDVEPEKPPLAVVKKDPQKEKAPDKAPDKGDPRQEDVQKIRDLRSQLKELEGEGGE